VEVLNQKSLTTDILHCNKWQKSEFTMLYQLYESQRSMMEPFSDLAQTAAKIFNNPLLPIGQMPFAQRVSAGYEIGRAHV
jgi:hypothetical protein